MKNLMLILTFMVLVSCTANSQENHVNQEISVESLKGDMGCENCGMNLKKFISTGHALKLENGESHYYCSINCSSIAIDSFGEKVIDVYGIDYGLTKYFPVSQLHYVIGSRLKGTMTRVSKFAFTDIEKANSFNDTFEGEKIVSYEEAYKMSKDEIASRK